MSKKTSLNPFCLAFGHNYFREINPVTNKERIICKCCDKEFIYSVNGNIVESPSEQYSLFPKVVVFKKC